MKNIINNNCSNNTNNEINNNKSEVKTMRKITNNTINFNANALNSSLIASAIAYEGNGRDGFLFGDDVNFEQLTAYCVLCEANHFETPTTESKASPASLRFTTTLLSTETSPASARYNNSVSTTKSMKNLKFASTAGVLKNTSQPSATPTRLSR